ncbi:MAG: GDSL-type esterase/lipase family protein, partial [Minicystis sp.]
MLKRLGRVPAKILVALLSVLACLAAAELVLRLTNPKRAPLPPLVTLCEDCPQLYQLNPKRANISSQRLRDREFTPFAAAGTHRILVLGDSLSYGMGVRHDETFPKQLEQTLNQGHGSFEVINSGTPGYTPYSELQYYLHTGRHFHPQVVVVSFCMNDVANPALHWAGFSLTQAASALPSASIPNHAYHSAHALPKLASQRKELRERARHRFTGAVQGTELYKRWHTLSLPAPAHVEHRGRSVPVFLVGEDSLSIEVLTDYASPEWGWLRSTYDQLAR